MTARKRRSMRLCGRNLWHGVRLRSACGCMEGFRRCAGLMDAARAARLSSACPAAASARQQYAHINNSRAMKNKRLHRAGDAAFACKTRVIQTAIRHGSVPVASRYIDIAAEAAQRGLRSCQATRGITRAQQRTRTAQHVMLNANGRPSAPRSGEWVRGCKIGARPPARAMQARVPGVA